VRLGSEVDDRARAVLGHQGADQVGIADVAVHEGVPRIAFDRREVREVAGVGQRVQADQRIGLGSHPLMDEVGTDEAGCAGHEDLGHGRGLYPQRIPDPPRPPARGTSGTIDGRQVGTPRGGATAPPSSFYPPS
jgi:hypothetical protein